MSEAQLTVGAPQVKRERRNHVFLALPRYGPVEPESRTAAYVEGIPIDSPTAVDPLDHPSSLLAYGFNQQWCACMNMGKYTHFAMLHSDVYPHHGWIQTLIDEMERGNFHVLHAVTAIKDNRGVTSTALGHVQYEWRKVRRVTLKELPRLSPTFDGPELAAFYGVDKNEWCLLPNTGCMIVKVDKWCRRFPGFTFKDRIVVQDEGGQIHRADEAPPEVPNSFNPRPLIPQVVPEDWNFGRWCAQHGLRVGATQKVKTDHFGRSRFPSYIPHGDWEVDEYFFNARAL